MIWYVPMCLDGEKAVDTATVFTDQLAEGGKILHGELFEGSMRIDVDD